MELRAGPRAGLQAGLRAELRAELQAELQGEPQAEPLAGLQGEPRAEPLAVLQGEPQVGPQEGLSAGDSAGCSDPRPPLEDARSLGGRAQRLEALPEHVAVHAILSQHPVRLPLAVPYLVSSRLVGPCLFRDHHDPPARPPNSVMLMFRRQGTGKERGDRHEQGATDEQYRIGHQCVTRSCLPSLIDTQDHCRSNVCVRVSKYSRRLGTESEIAATTSQHILWSEHRRFRVLMVEQSEARRNAHRHFSVVFRRDRHSQYHRQSCGRTRVAGKVS